MKDYLLYGMLFVALLFGIPKACAMNAELAERNRQEMAEWNAKREALAQVERAKQERLIKLCLDKGGVPSVSSGNRLERCDFPRPAAESYCIWNGTKWLGPSFCSTLPAKRESNYMPDTEK